VVVYVHAATGPTALQRLETERQQLGYESMADVSITGEAAAIAAAVGRWADAGADTVVLQPTPDEPDLEGLVRLVATTPRPGPA
jgi:alkanesulfonate monooxygenase SsuD/methylene tetrahydromethanopterin reductase-like flavin-dependent oxidoreductase (luciferase family)